MPIFGSKSSSPDGTKQSSRMSVGSSINKGAKRASATLKGGISGFATGLAYKPLELAIKAALATIVEKGDDDDDDGEATTTSGKYGLTIDGSGSVVITNLRIKSSAIDAVMRTKDLPFRAPLVYIEKLEIKLPWVNWVSGTIEVTLDKLLVVVKPVYAEERPGAEEVREAKEALVTKAMMALYKAIKRMGKSPSFIDGIIGKIKSSVALRVCLRVSNVHFRLEDGVEKASCGLLVPKMVIVPRDADDDDKDLGPPDYEISVRMGAYCRLGKGFEETLKAATFDEMTDALTDDVTFGLGGPGESSSSSALAIADGGEPEWAQQLLNPIDITGSLRREALETDLTVSVTPVQINLEDRLVATLHAWLGLLEGYALWKNHMLLTDAGQPEGGGGGDLTSFRRRSKNSTRASASGGAAGAAQPSVDSPLRPAFVRRRWHNAVTAVIHTIVSKAPPGTFGGGGISELAVHAKKRRGYQEIYLKLCQHPNTSFSAKTGRMDVSRARQSLSAADASSLRAMEAELPVGTLARWRVQVITSGSFQSKGKRSQEELVGEVDAVAKGLLGGKSQTDRPETVAEEGEEGEGGEDEAAKPPPSIQRKSSVLGKPIKKRASTAAAAQVKTTSARLQIAQFQLALVCRPPESGGYGSAPSPRGVLTVTIEGINVLKEGAKAAEAQKNVVKTTKVATVTLDALAVRSPCVASLNGTADMLTMGKNVDGHVVEARIGEAGQVDVSAGSMKMIHLVEAMAELERFFVPTVEEMGRWPLMSSKIFRGKMRLGKLQYSVDEQLRPPWWQFDHNLMVALKSATDPIAGIPRSLDLSVGPIAVRLLEPQEERRAPNRSPDEIIWIDVPRLNMVRDLPKDSPPTAKAKTSITFDGELSFEALAALTSIRKYREKMYAARRWQSDQGHNKRLAALLADRAQRQQLQLAALGGGERAEERRERMERERLIEAVRVALREEREATRRPPSNAWRTALIYMLIGMMLMALINLYGDLMEAEQMLKGAGKASLALFR